MQTSTTLPKKKILYVITKSNWGGAQRYVFDLALAFKYEFDVAVALGGRGPLAAKLEENDIRVIYLPEAVRDVSLGGDYRTFCNLITLFKKLRPDVVHLNSSKMGGIGALAARLAGIKKIIFTGHGWVFNEKRPWYQKPIILFLHWLTLLLVHTTIAVSEKTRSDVAFLPFVSKKITLIYNGLPKTPVASRSTSRTYLSELHPLLKEIKHSREKRLWVGTISELHRNKGVDIALQAIDVVRKKHPDILFLVLGEGEERKHLEHTIRQKGLERHVILLGFVPNASNFIAAFDVFTLTSRTEAMPYAILEAGRARIPVVASHVGGVSEIIDQLRSGITVRPENVKELSQALTYLIENDEKREALGHNLEKVISTKFSQKVMLDSTRNLY
jgi:glycosyltransferase involved in cell wall biosynthesis